MCCVGGNAIASCGLSYPIVFFCMYTHLGWSRHSGAILSGMDVETSVLCVTARCIRREEYIGCTNFGPDLNRMATAISTVRFRIVTVNE